MTKSLPPEHVNLLAGRLSRDDIPAVKAHVIRVYICAVGTDSMTERDVFVENVYPKLRAYCKDRYGLEFQVSDLTWGLSAAEIENQTDLTPLRIREIQRCHALSAGPNFIWFLFHAHVLLNSFSLDEAVRATAQSKWEEVQAELRSLLQKGADLAYLDGAMDSESKERYYVSELENQILLGIEANDHPKKRCILVTRNIDDLKNYTQDQRTPRFAEIKYIEREDRFELDPDSAAMLERLRQRVINLVSPHNTIHHDVLWKYDEVIHPHLHKTYLDSLSDQLYKACIRLIDENAPLPELDVPSLCEEAAQHWSRCRYMASHYYKPDQDSPLQALRDYVTGASDTPLIVHGAPGCGKSKIVSKLVFDMEDTLFGEYMLVLRYIGHTPKSRDLKQLLSSVCSQITLALGASPAEVPIDVNELIKYFAELIATFPPTCRLILLMDDLELLLPDHDAHRLHWVPARLPPHVKLILAVHHSSYRLLNKFKDAILPDRSDCFLEVPSATVDECTGLLSKLLSSMDRGLTDAQMKVFREALEKEPLPLYVELLANVAKDLKSFDSADKIKLPTNSEDGINCLLEKLESRHGKMLVSRAFAYMVASSTGLSDCEMEDVLSLDEDVLNEIYNEDFHPRIRRVPYIKWLALKQDVEAFLAYKDADGVTVAGWQHDSFVDAVRSRYLTDKLVVSSIHSTLADYFLGTWAGKPKPVSVLGGKRQLVASYNSDRKVPAQPLTFGGSAGGGTGAVRFNKRMYDQVPRHLDLAGRYKELNSLVFFNYEWLYNKIKALSLQHIMSDLALNPSEEVSLVEEALRVSEHTVERDINSLPTEITGHLLPYYETHPNIRSLIRQCDTDGLRHCALVPNFPYLQVPGSSLQFTLAAPDEMEHFCFVRGDVLDDNNNGGEERLLVCKKRDDAYVNVFDLLTGELKATVFASNGELYITPNGKYLVIVDHVTEKAIKIHETATGAFLKQIIMMNHIDGKSSLYKKGPLSVTNDRLCAVVTITNSVLCICEIPTGKILHIVALDGKSNVCTISPNGSMVLCNSNGFLLAYDLYSLEHLLTVPIGSTPSRLLFTRDGLRAFLSNDKDTRVTIMHLNGKSVDMTYRAVLEDKMPRDSIRDLKISPNDQLLLIRGDVHLLVYHRGLEKIIATFTKPESVPEEFRLPKAHYVQMKFTHADFTKDSDFVVGTIFRNVYVWQISSGNLVTSIQAPIGIITDLLVSKIRSQVLTHMRGSKNIEVWNIDAAVRKVNTPDKLTDSISEFRLTSDSRLAFVRCRRSDEIGVISMANGSMVDLLTHDNPVLDFAITPNGNWALVSTEPRLKGTAFKLWNLSERRVVMEVGNVAGYCVSMNNKQGIVMLAQKDASYKSPFYISVLHTADGEFYEHAYMHTVTTIRSKPFVTENDQFLVINSAIEARSTLSTSDDANSVGSSSPTFSAKPKPCIYVFDMERGMKVTVCDAVSMKFEEHLQDIFQVWPCSQFNRSLVAAIFSCKDHQSSPDDDLSDGGYASSSSGTVAPGYPYGFFLLDAATGNLAQLCIPFPKPSLGVGSNPLIFSKDCMFCLDEQSNIFHIPNGDFVGQLSSPLNPPRTFVLRDTIIIYYHGSTLLATRMADGVPVAQCDVHSTICLVHVCPDDRTVLVGCEDGGVLSYTVIDPVWENPSVVLNCLPSREVGDHEKLGSGLTRRSWDKVEGSAPGYQRPPSAMTPFTSDKHLLREIKALPRPRPKSDSHAELGTKSQACSLM
ncbi:NACHT and WD repeat domain-containing protein 2-like [Elysia marginata]|uniref:NACHT and WD repeat domain-containing protein 2-like n=1 Tax=Elysia marginata TaxID=1093978 RepID=A0AAV4G0C8_9GAST|nr:NACHT and WD repeat domain-containing protein 2-like [Elysia marginata]